MHRSSAVADEFDAFESRHNQRVSSRHRFDPAPSRLRLKEIDRVRRFDGNNLVSQPVALWKAEERYH